MGDNLKIIDLGTNFFVDQLSCGYKHTCALSTDHHIKCFGSNPYGELGYDHTATLGDGSGEMGDDLPFVDLGTDFEAVQVECGGHHSCARSATFGVKCWGY